MLHNLLSYFTEACPLCDDRNVAVHFTIHVNVLYHFTFVGLQSAIEIVQVVYARKTKPITMPDQVYLTLAPSHTKGRLVELIISPEHLPQGERVLIIDDFLATGATILGLVRLAETAGAKIVGIGTLIEKNFEGGRNALKKVGVPVESLAIISSMENNTITFAE